MDAKSLLRAKKASTKVDHPHATYTASGQLKCSVCAVPVTQWDSHLLTKQHRTSVARENALQAKSNNKSKRPAEEAAISDSSKKVKVSSSILPAGFFSSGNPAPIVVDDGDDEEEEEVPQAGPSRDSSSMLPPPVPVKSTPTPVTSATTTTGPAATGDAELDDFLTSLSSDIPESEPEPISQAPTIPVPPKKTGYKTSSSSSLPVQASYEAAPVRNIPKVEEKEEEVEPEESDQQRRERVAREEREEILGRLEDEERAQEDADSRVASLRARMEMLKKKREASGKGKSKSKTTNGTATNGATTNGTSHA